MANALRIGLLGPLQVRDEAGRPVHVAGRQLRVLLTLLALDAGRVVPAASPSSLPRYGCARSRPNNWLTAWTTGSPCSPAAAGPRCPGTRRSGRWWTGAAPRARDGARRQLGEAAFAAAYERGRALSRHDAVALAASAVESPVQALLCRIRADGSSGLW
ncbi:MAG: hypothetical protein ACRDPY_06735 [Streptosporangiaceae bacterium]